MHRTDKPHPTLDSNCVHCITLERYTGTYTALYVWSYTVGIFLRSNRILLDMHF